MQIFGPPHAIGVAEDVGKLHVAIVVMRYVITNWQNGLRRRRTIAWPDDAIFPGCHKCSWPPNPNGDTMETTYCDGTRKANNRSCPAHPNLVWCASYKSPLRRCSAGKRARFQRLQQDGGKGFAVQCQAICLSGMTNAAMFSLAMARLARRAARAGMSLDRPDIYTGTADMPMGP